MKVLVCGSRHCNDRQTVKETLGTLGFSITEIIEGGASGADSLARSVGEEFGVPVHTFPADWDKYGKGAGPIRNKQMLDEGKPDVVVAFLTPDSIGAKNMIEQAAKAGITVKVIELAN